jgi:WD40 repeat protein
MRFGESNCGVSFHQFGLNSGQSGQYGQTDILISTHDDLHAKPISCACFTESGSILSTGSFDGSIRIWKIFSNFYNTLGKSLQLLATLSRHLTAITSLDISEKIQMIVSASNDDSKVCVWNLNSLSFLRELKGHLSTIDAVCFNKTTGNVVTLSNSELKIWSINGSLIAKCSAAALRKSLPTTAISTQCGYWQDGIVAVTGHDNGDISLWGINWTNTANKGENVKDLVCRRVLNGAHNKPISCIRISDDQRELLIGDYKGVVSRWQCLRLGDLSQAELSDLTSA